MVKPSGEVSNGKNFRLRRNFCKGKSTLQPLKLQNFRLRRSFYKVESYLYPKTANILPRHSFCKLKTIVQHPYFVAKTHSYRPKLQLFICTFGKFLCNVWLLRKNIQQEPAAGAKILTCLVLCILKSTLLQSVKRQLRRHFQSKTSMFLKGKKRA